VEQLKKKRETNVVYFNKKPDQAAKDKRKRKWDVKKLHELDLLTLYL